MPAKLPDELVKQRFINIRSTPQEWEEVTQAAAERSLTVSELVREGLRAVGALREVAPT